MGKSSVYTSIFILVLGILIAFQELLAGLLLVAIGIILLLSYIKEIRIIKSKIERKARKNIKNLLGKKR